MDKHRSLSYVFITHFPSTVKHDSRYAHSVSHFLRQYQNCWGTICILRHWSHPPRKISVIIAYIYIIYTCHIGDYKYPSFFITFGDVTCIIWGPTKTCVNYENHGDDFGDDLIWRDIFLSLWSIFSWFDGLVIFWR